MAVQAEDLTWEAAADDELDTVLSDLLLSSEDDSEEVHGGSRPERVENIEKNRKQYALQLHQDYSCSSPTYPNHLFQPRFRVSKAIFSLCDRFFSQNRYFCRRKDCTGRRGHSTYQKVTTVIRMLAYGCGADMLHETLQRTKSTALQCLYEFADSVVTKFSKDDLCAPTEGETRKLLFCIEKLGSPGTLGSIDCCKCVWKNCPTVDHGPFKGNEKVPTITI